MKPPHPSLGGAANQCQGYRKGQRINAINAVYTVMLSDSEKPLEDGSWSQSRHVETEM